VMSSVMPCGDLPPYPLVEREGILRNL
jgi:hypothetical protein